jgi:RNA polymerase sigma-70 factor (ECF subfamily)
MVRKSSHAPNQPDPMAETLSEQLAAADSDTISRLYDTHAVSVFSLALHIVNDQREAETIVEQTFQHAQREANRFDPERDSVNSWLLRITRRLAVDAVRSRSGSGISVNAATVQLPDPAQRQRFDVASTDVADVLRNALIRLPRLERISVELAYFEGLSPVQIAERLEHPMEVIRDKVQMGLHTLRTTLEAKRDGD